MKRPGPIDRLVKDISALPADFHAAGVLDPDVLHTIARLGSAMDLAHTAETGSGKSTLLLSHLSADHTVFALDRFGDFDAHSMSAVQESELFNAANCRFVVGPTQVTLPAHRFTAPLDLVLIDGPHGYPFPELEYYYFYPHLRPGALLIVDDIQIPTIARLFDFLCRDEMYELVEVTLFTAFFRRTAAPVFNPRADGWWLQGFNAHYRNVIRERALRGVYGWGVPTPQATAGTADTSVIEAGTDGNTNWHYQAYRLTRAVAGQRFADRCLAAWRAFRS